MSRDFHAKMVFFFSFISHIIFCVFPAETYDFEEKLFDVFYRIITKYEIYFRVYVNACIGYLGLYPYYEIKINIWANYKFIRKVFYGYNLYKFH